MSDHDQRLVSTPPSGPGAARGWAFIERSREGRVPLGFSTEPSFADMVGDPMFQQLLASDRVSMDCLNGLVSATRQRLAG